MQSNDEAPADQRRLTLILFNVCVGQFIVGLDQRALLVALPTLTHTFNTSLTTIQWVLLIYDLLLIGTVITVGRLGDLFGRRRYYAAGFLVFVLSSALCGAAQSAWQIILFRGLQAVGGAMISANGRAIASVAFPASERGKAMGFASMAFHVGFLTGPTLGGFLIDTVGWRWIFYLNLPVGIWGAYLAWKLLEESKDDVKDISVDFPGAILLMATCSLFLYAMNQLPHLGWRDSSVVIMLMLSMVACALFVFVELRSRMPILSFALFRNRLFTASMLSLFFITSTQSAISFLMPFYLQNILHFSPTHMGWILIANSVVIVLIAPIAGWLSDRMGSRLLCTAGSGLIVIGQFFIASLGVDSSIPRIILPLLLIGLGWAIFNSPNQSAILGSVPRDKVGTASGMNTTTARTGGAMGVALSATLFTYGLAAAGLTRAQVESPQSWGEAPELFVRSFNHTVHIVNVVTLLSVFFSAVRGRRQE
ncbi:MAG: DHA2 family efflux MFS transporter permease subunit [Deltaproteobacteria bacterium]|jgi:EmrB/QacA subfamily drug resistance transporter|nr:MAG: DHA2 family efflux MFS transporter permease subunit [Deltaproteobacteria bacterium]